MNINNFNLIINNFPIEIRNEILKYLVSDTGIENIINVDFITFKKYIPNHSDTNYSEKYQIGYIRDGINRVHNNKGFFLSRIYKHNGKHRYYITQQIISAYCNSCGDRNCKSLYCGADVCENTYKSFPVGTNIVYALYKLFNTQNL